MSRFSVAGGAIEAQDAEIAGGGANFPEGLLQFFKVFGLNIDVELVFKGLAVDGAAFDLQQIYAMIGKGFEGSEQSAGLVSQAHGQRHLARVRGAVIFGLGGRQEQNESREILRVILNAWAKNDRAVVAGGTKSRN